MGERKKPQFQLTANGTFRTQVRDPLTKRRISVTAKTPLELLQRKGTIDQLREDVRLGRRGPREIARLMGHQIYGELTALDIWREWAVSKPEGSTSRVSVDSVWRNRFAPNFSKARAWELTEPVMIQWEANQLRVGIARRTIQTAFEYLTSAYRMAIRGGRLDDLPWGGWRPKREKPKEREACRSIEEFEAMVRAARDVDSEKWRRGHYADLTYRILVVGLCGMRQGEGAGLGWDCVEIDKEPFHLKIHYQATDGWRQRHPEWRRPMDPPKSGSAAALVLHPSAVLALRAQREQLKARGRYRPDGPVFPAKGVEWRSNASVIDPVDVRKVVALADLPNVDRWVTHSLRHTFSTLEVVSSGGDLKTVQRRTRHTSTRMLEGYLHSAGRGLPATSIPSLPEHVVPQHHELAGVMAEAKALPPAQTLSTTGAALASLAIDTHRAAEQGREFHQAKASADRRERHRIAVRKHKSKSGRKVVAFAEIAAELIRSGEDTSVRPPEVTRALDEAYTRAYNAELRASADPDKARGAGARARRARAAAWARVLGTVAARLSVGVPSEA